jgi:hypothetical protein
MLSLADSQHVRSWCTVQSIDCNHCVCCHSALSCTATVLQPVLTKLDVTASLTAALRKLLGSLQQTSQFKQAFTCDTSPLLASLYSV